jgi:hypothetical protein
MGVVSGIPRAVGAVVGAISGWTLRSDGGSQEASLPSELVTPDREGVPGPPPPLRQMRRAAEDRRVRHRRAVHHAYPRPPRPEPASTGQAASDPRGRPGARRRRGEGDRRVPRPDPVLTASGEWRRLSPPPPPAVAMAFGPHTRACEGGWGRADVPHPCLSLRKPPEPRRLRRRCGSNGQ